MKKFFKLYACLLVLGIFIACDPEPEPPLTVATINNETVEPHYKSVKVSCELSSNFTIEYAKACLYLTTDFTEVYSMTLLTRTSEGVYEGEIDGLKENTTYYIRYQIINTWSSYFLEQVTEFQTYSRDMPIVLTKSVFDVSYTTAKLYGEVKTDGGYPILERGFCCSKSDKPTTQDNKMVHGSGLGTFLGYLADLEEGATYFVRAYAVNETGTYYGKSIQFTTFARTFHEGHEYVDLGLSVKWATCNVGAESPSMMGDYFAFGEVEPKEIYNWSTYKWCTANNGKLVALTKYYQSISGSPINLSVEDDAAHVNWGGEWRMPTASEIYELIENCSWEYVGGGYKVKSLINGNSISLPAGGCMNGASVFKLGEQGYYWSAGILDLEPTTARVIYFNSDTYFDTTSGREKGCLVRPVYPK